MPLFQTITDIESSLDVIQRRAYGVIQADDERFVSISFRPYPKLISGAEAYWAGSWGQGTYKRNRCLVYFNQPMLHRNFLTLQYIVSTLDTSWISCAVALSVLDRVAQIKQSDAILCELSNNKFSPRVLSRFGWERHLKQKKRKHFIKRFYGKYPDSYQYMEIQNRKPSGNKSSQAFPIVGAGLDSTPGVNQSV